MYLPWLNGICDVSHRWNSPNTKCSGLKLHGSGWLFGHGLRLVSLLEHKNESVTNSSKETADLLFILS